MESLEPRLLLSAVAGFAETDLAVSVDSTADQHASDPVFSDGQTLRENIGQHDPFEGMAPEDLTDLTTEPSESSAPSPIPLATHLIEGEESNGNSNAHGDLVESQNSTPSDLAYTLTSYGEMAAQNVTHPLVVRINALLSALFLNGSNVPTIPPNGAFAPGIQQGTFGAGGYLNLINPEIRFTNLTYANQSWSGNVRITAATAQIKVNASKTIAVNAAMINGANHAVDQSFTFAGPQFAFPKITSFTLGTIADATQLDWPAWMNATVTSLSIAWSSFNQEPAKATVAYSVELHGFSLPEFPGSELFEIGINALAVVQGVAQGVKVDLSALAANKSAITDIEIVSAGIGLTIPALGSFQLTLLIGVAKMDAFGEIIQPTDLTTPVHKTVVFGGATGTGKIGDWLLNKYFNPSKIIGDRGISIRIAFSELGPLQIYVEVFDPLVLDPVSGLTINDFRGGISFNNPLPSITEATQLRSPDFKPVKKLSVVDWTNQIIKATYNQLEIAHDTDDYTWGNFSALLDGTADFRFEAGATLYNQNVKSWKATADVDLIFSTDGKFLMRGALNLLVVAALPVTLFADFSKTTTGTTEFFILMDLPEVPTTSTLLPVISLNGTLKVTFTTANGLPASAANPANDFKLVITGGLDINLPFQAPLSIKGVLTVETEGDKMTINLASSEINLPGIGNFSGVTAVFQVENPRAVRPSLTGYVAFDGDIHMADIGLDVTGSLFFMVNTTTSTKTIAATDVNGKVTNFTLAGSSSEFRVDGSLEVTLLGAELLVMNGKFAMKWADETFTINAPDIEVVVGPKSASLLTFNATVLLNVTSKGVVGYFAVSINSGFDSSTGVTIDGDGFLYVNTLGTDFQFAGAGGVTHLVPRAAPPFGTNIGSTWTLPTSTKGKDYLVVQINDAELTIADVFTATGKFNLLVQTGSIDMDVDAALNLKIGSTTLLDFDLSGVFSIGSHGATGQLTLDLQASDIDQDIPVSLSGDFLFKINTTESKVTSINGQSVDLPADSVFLQLNGILKVGGFSIDGLFEITRNSSYLQIAGSAGLNLKNGSTSLMDFEAEGVLRIYQEAVIGYFKLTVDTDIPDSYGFNFSATYIMEVNSKGDTMTLSKPALLTGGSASSTATVSKSAYGTTSTSPYAQLRIKGDLEAGPITLTGTFIATISATSLSISVDATIGIGDKDFSAKGKLTINYGSTHRGMALSTALTLAGADSFKFGTVTVSGTFDLKINTSDVTLDGIAAKSFSVAIKGKASVFGFELSGGLTIGFGGITKKVEIDGVTYSAPTVGMYIIITSPLTMNYFGAVEFQVTGWLLQSGRFYFSASALIDLTSSSGGASAGINGSLNLKMYNVSNLSAFSVKLVGTASANLSYFGITVGATATVDASISSTGTASVSVSATILGVNISMALNINLANGGSISDGPVRGATVFLDANLNSIHDANELFAVTDADGHYTFPAFDLSLYDLNSNGFIDPAEGELVSTGGIDNTTGLANTTTYRSSAASLGSGFATSMSPVSSLLAALIRQGVPRETAENLLRHVFRISNQMLPDSFNPAIETLKGTEGASQVLRTASFIQLLLSEGAALVHGVKPSITLGAAAVALTRFLAEHIIALPPGAELHLTDAKHVQSILVRAASHFGLIVPPFLLKDVSEIIAESMKAVESLPLSDDSLYFAAVHRIQKLGLSEVANDIKAVASGTLLAKDAHARHHSLQLAFRAAITTIDRALHILPTITSYHVNGSNPSRSTISAVSITLSKDPGMTLTKADLSILRKVDGSVVDLNMEFVNFLYDANSRTATWVLRPEAFGAAKLPDGDYRIVINGAGLHDLAGTPFDLAGTGVAGSSMDHLFQLQHGDIDGDGLLTPVDLGVLRHLIKTNGYDSEFDFNYDNLLNNLDVAHFKAAFLAAQVEVSIPVQAPMVKPVVLADHVEMVPETEEANPLPLVLTQPPIVILDSKAGPMPGESFIAFSSVEGFNPAGAFSAGLLAMARISPEMTEELVKGRKGINVRSESFKGEGLQLHRNEGL